MSENEKKFLASLCLLISVLILGVIIYFRIDFNNIKIKILSTKMLYCLEKREYESFYENLDDDNKMSLDKFIENINFLNEELGEIEKYKYVAMYINDSDNKDIRRIVYNIKFSNCCTDDVKLILTFKLKTNKWYISKYEFTSDDKNINSCLNTIKIMNLNYEENMDIVNKSEEVIKNFKQAYTNENYKYIYENLSKELTLKGGEDEFIKYMKDTHDKYGDISNIKLKGYEISKDESEYKFNYFDDYKKIYITFWVKINDDFKLSGINFSENMWD